MSLPNPFLQDVELTPDAYADAEVQAHLGKHLAEDEAFRLSTHNYFTNKQARKYKTKMRIIGSLAASIFATIGGWITWILW